MTYLKQLSGLLFIIFLANPFLSSAQQQKEVGFGTDLTSLFENFNLSYKLQKKENKWFRLNATFGNFNYVKTDGFSNASARIGFSLGLEKRKTIGSSPVEILRGPQFLLATDLNNLTSDGGDLLYVLQGGLGYVFGSQVHLKKNVKIGLETMPAILLSYSNEGDGILNIDFGFNSNALVLFAVYNFNRPEKN